MPWKQSTTMSQRTELAQFAASGSLTVTELARRYGVSRKTAHKWIQRFKAADSLEDRSRRPLHCPHQTPAPVEEAIVEARDRHPYWGARKLHRWLLTRERCRRFGLRPDEVPAPSTITRVLKRYGRVTPEASRRATPYVRFERPEPNDLWQMDFKGHFTLGSEQQCHPLTVLDDHSRFALGIRACADEQTASVKAALSAIMRCYGLPLEVLCDNGSCWSKVQPVNRRIWTQVEVWLMRLSVRICHGRPVHPQTQGKDERFHRSLKTEVLSGRCYRDLRACQRAFDAWRRLYNEERPHEALALDVPVAHYRPSRRSFPERLPDPDYGPGDVVRKVEGLSGRITFQGRTHRVGKAFAGQRVALRPSGRDGRWKVHYFSQEIATIDLRRGHARK